MLIFYWPFPRRQAKPTFIGLLLEGIPLHQADLEAPRMAIHPAYLIQGQFTSRHHIVGNWPHLRTVEGADLPDFHLPKL